MPKENNDYKDGEAFVKIDDDHLAPGEVDLGAARLLLEGTQEAMNYLLKREDSSLAKKENIDYPIITREGSWEILIPFGTFVAGAVGGAFIKGLNSYASVVGAKIGEKQLAAKETREIFENAFKKLDIIIKIAQHLGVIDRKQPLNTRIVDYQSKKVLLINNEGNVLSTTLDEIQVYLECPQKLFRSLASVVTDHRTVTIGYMSQGTVIQSIIDRDTKEIFAPDEDQHEPILPELQDGQYVTLRGYVSRGNQITNTIGFKYKDHVITCEPTEKLITGYINAHYKMCDISGVITRTSKLEVEHGKTDRPKIKFDRLIVVPEVGMTSQLSMIDK